RPSDEWLFATTNGTLLRHRALLHHLHWHDELDKTVTVRGQGVTRHGFTGTGQGHRFHDLRHGAAVRWLRAGIDIKTVQAWLGHASAAMTLDRYAHYIGQDADDAAIARLDALDDPKPAGKARAKARQPRT
ncbi:MAG: tyrosine-type recombinase/integrase, partial [Propionibacteriaceae bacterium]|nr:tyrosine-type recombinase/integrase [Propionibacteriaceae bacterium]